MVACSFVSIGKSQSRRAINLEVSKELLLISAKKGFIVFVKLLHTCKSGIIITVLSSVFMQIPLNMLPLDAFIAF